MKQFYCFLICLTFFSAAAAQNNYLPGYVIMNEGDTLYGLIDYKLEKINQETCFFKENNASPARIYSPKDISGYRFLKNGKYYVSKNIDLNDTVRKVFLEYMVNGMMDLFYYVIDGQPYFFFEDENGKMFSVTKEKDRIDEFQVKRDNKYDGIIRYKFRDYHSIARYNKKFDFNQKSMINIVKTYHENVCTSGDACIIYENVKPDDKEIDVNISVYTGLEVFVFGFDYDRLYMNIPTVPLGGEFEFIHPQLSKNIGLYADVSITKMDRVVDNIKYGEDVYSYYKKFYFDVYPVSLRLGIKYTYPVKSFKPFIKAGFSSKHLFPGNQLLVQSKRRYLDDTQNLGPASSFYRKNYSGLHIGIGTGYQLKNECDLYFSLIFDSYVSKSYANFTPLLSDSFTAYSVRLGYVFK